MTVTLVDNGSRADGRAGKDGIKAFIKRGINPRFYIDIIKWSIGYQ